ncbi:LacI family DNA-binding transcriptional regulator [Acuticoccus sp. M5D2P5]|uniref:LacI family DNA-binding transcriptional regulator n=1 Tax=Acuticoccus kalidii TaxID=2910977 RepID=UPI001F359E97|nr:LacI family DNA-binding transcriptional regulator [Acuticoccus kalidii]MCF3934564.1 LacI family DNA-binding transcriptional regulator [Acuticoccus kalidii]
MESEVSAGRRPDMKSVALAAGVSLATVDRVLNRRAGVHRVTRERVLIAAQSIGYLSPNDATLLSRPEAMKVAVLLPRGGNPYLVSLGATTREIAARTHHNVNMRCRFVPAFDGKALVAALEDAAGWADGIAFMAIDEPMVAAAVNRLVARGKRIVSIVTDVPGSRRHAFVGIDNEAAGRTAAMLLTRFAGLDRPDRPGTLALLAATRTYRAHAEREAGFQNYLAAHAPWVRLAGPLEGRDDRGRNRRFVERLLEREPNLVGIYNSGGSSEGIGAALCEAGRRIAFIGHGLTADTRDMLTRGVMDAVLTQRAETMIATALAALERDLEDTTLSMQIVFATNLPPASNRIPVR